MSNESNQLIDRVTSKYADVAAKHPDLFPQFAQQVAPTIEFLESEGIIYDVFTAHSFMGSWSIVLMPDVKPSQNFVVKSSGERPLEVHANGMPVNKVRTPTDLLNYARQRLVTPSP